MKKDNRGGARKNAGRKPLGKDVVQLSIKIPKEILDKVSQKYTASERNEKIRLFLESL